MQPRGRRGNNKDEKRMQGWDIQNNAQECVNDRIVYVGDCKVVYQKAIFYFSLQSKLKSVKGCEYGFPAFPPSYQADLVLIGNTKFRKRCGDERFLDEKVEARDNVVNWRPYQGSRSLSHYDFQAEFHIKHPDASTMFSLLGSLRIVDGY